jgi:hypothetical protein
MALQFLSSLVYKSSGGCTGGRGRAEDVIAACHLSFLKHMFVFLYPYIISSVRVKFKYIVCHIMS